MAKREKILIGLCAAGLIFLVYSSFIGKEKKSVHTTDNAPTTASTDQFVTEQLILLKKSDRIEADRQIISKAAVNWENDPFASQELIRQIEGYAENEKTPSQINKEKQEPLLYSGYIKVGDKVLAIVNGMEYEKGDTIEGTSYEVFSVSIATESIMLRSPDSTIKTVYISDEVETEKDRRKSNI